MRAQPATHRHSSTTGSVTTLRQWETAVLNGIGAPHTKANYAFLNAWVRREGGGGRNNPLNTTMPEPGATSFNSIGVRNYDSLAEGATATVRTLDSHYYTDIVKALRSGHPSRSRRYTGLSTWSGHGYSSLTGVSGGTPSYTASSAEPVASVTSTSLMQPKHLLVIGAVLLVIVLIVRK